jgi:hypothetical protein
MVTSSDSSAIRVVAIGSGAPPKLSVSGERSASALHAPTAIAAQKDAVAIREFVVVNGISKGLVERFRRGLRSGDDEQVTRRSLPAPQYVTWPRLVDGIDQGLSWWSLVARHRFSLLGADDL